jgi:hypothetical protein
MDHAGDQFTTRLVLGKAVWPVQCRNSLLHVPIRCAAAASACAC